MLKQISVQEAGLVDTLQANNEWALKEADQMVTSEQAEQLAEVIHRYRVHSWIMFQDAQGNSCK